MKATNTFERMEALIGMVELGNTEIETLQELAARFRRESDYWSGVGDASNEDRARWALNALQMFMYDTGVDPEDAVADLIANIMHLMDCDPSFGIMAKQYERGVSMYAQECMESPRMRRTTWKRPKQQVFSSHRPPR